MDQTFRVVQANIPSNMNKKRESIKDELLSKLSQSRERYPERLQKPVCVLDIVESDVQGQLQQRLRQAKIDYQGERIALIPYLWNDHQWNGILLKFNVSGLIEYAQFFDPVINSDIDVKVLQATVDRYYPGVILQTKDLLKHKDLHRSATLTIENLLEAVTSIEEEMSTTKCDSGETQTNHSTNNAKIETMQEQISECSFSIETYDELVQTLKTGFEKRDLRNKEELMEDLRDKREEIEKLESKEKYHVAQRRKNSLRELERLSSLVEQKELFDIIKSQELNASDQESDFVFQSTEEFLNDLYDDIHEMPICSERSVLSILLYVNLRSCKIKSVENSHINIPDDLLAQIKMETNSLRETLEQEELFSAETAILLKTLINYIENEYWNPVIPLLNTLKKRISPLDVRELKRLVEKVDDAARSIEGKDVILFLGGTGAGKSTTIHFLAGSEIVEEKLKGLHHLAPRNIRNSQLKKIITAPFARAQTRYITAVSMSMKEIGGSSDDIVTLCDCPGFDDTSGAEVDIANGIGIIRAIRGCKFVKPVILISYKSMGDRCSGIRDLARTIVGLIPDIQDHRRSFSYIFTKFPREERNSIPSIIKDLCNRLSDEEKLDLNYKTFLEDILDKSRRNALVLDPVKDDPYEILHELVTSTKITHPEEVFHVFISNKSKVVLQEQTRQDQLCILRSIQQGNYGLINYKLDQLRFLKNLVLQPYVERSYEISIAYVTDHLQEQYKRAIETLNHFFEDSIALIEEDIQFYHKLFHLSEEAESLRTRHLSSTETTHCSAYQSYLDKQVGLFCERLGAKEIDDASITMDLNKLNILTKYFPIHTNTYENIRSIFKEKLESLILLFKASVNSHTFEKTGEYLSQMQIATSIFHDHLDQKYFNTVHTQLREYLLNHLQDMVNQSNSILKRESLNENDIDYINQCLSTIETARNTPILETQISNDFIANIHQPFLLILTSYFANLHNRFTEALERQDPWKSLELFMQRLVMIRRIPAVELKTSQLYSETVEKLIGHVRTTVRDIEFELVNLTITKENINPHKLIEDLIKLREMQWIETYRPGIYTTLVTDIYGQTVQYMIELKQSVLSVPLDLDNHENIEPMYKKISMMSEFKQLEKEIPSIYSEHYQAVSDWFLIVLKDQINLINENFSIEQWCQNKFQGLNFEKIEKSFYYLNRCQQIPLLLNSHCMLVLDNLTEFIRCYSNYIQKEMEKSLQSIIENQNENNEDISLQVRLLETRLEEISRVRGQYLTVFSHFINRKIYENWQTELSDYLLTLSDVMEQSIRIQKIDSLMHQLLITKALSKLDKFLDNESFMDLHRKYQDKLYNQLKTIQQQSIQVIQTNLFEQIPLQIEVLLSSKELAEYFVVPVRRTLNSQLENLLDQAKTEVLMLDNNMDIEKIKTIADLSRILQKGKQFASTYLSITVEIDACMDFIRKELSKRMHRFIQSIEALITTNHFEAAETKIQSLRLIRHSLKNLCSSELSQDIDELRQNRLLDRLKTLVIKYSNMDVSEYSLEPPIDILAQLTQVKYIDPIYIQTYQDLMESIVMNFRRVLDDARAVEPPSIDNLHIRKFQSGIKFVPKAMQESLQMELEHCKNDIELKIRQPEHRLIEQCKTGSIKNMKTILDGYQKSSEMQTYLVRGKEFLARHIQDCITETKRLFDENNVARALENIKKLNQYRLEFKSQLPDLEVWCNEIKDQVKRVFDQAHLCFINGFLKNPASRVLEHEDKAIERSFLCLSEFLKFIDLNKNEIGLSHFFPNDVHEQIRILHENIASHLSQVQNNYNQALQNFDLEQLKRVLDNAQRWDPLFLIMKTSYSTDLLKNSVTTLTLFSDILESVVRQLKVYRDSVIGQELINDETKQSSTQIEKFYRKLNAKVILFDRFRLLQLANIAHIGLENIERECITSLEKKIDALACAAMNILEKLIQDVPLNKTDDHDFNLYFDHMKSFAKEMTALKSSIHQKIKMIEKKVSDKIANWKLAIESTPDSSFIVKILIRMKVASNSFPSFKCLIEEQINGALHQLQTSKQRSKIFEKIIVLLPEDETGIGQMILEDCKIFYSYSVSLFNQKTRIHGVDYVLQNIQGDCLDKSKLRQSYDQYQSMYDSLLKQYLKSTHTFEPLITNTRSIANNIKQQNDNMCWNFDLIRSTLIQLFAHLCVLWTLQNATPFSESTGLNNNNSSIPQPHVAQVIGMMRMIGIGDEIERFRNHLVQIESGEGKSLVLAITACLFALIGFDVYCTCFSQYLSQRDFQSYLSLFTSLDLLNHVHYGSFNDLCEYAINDRNNVRIVTEQLLTKYSLDDMIRNRKTSNSARVLLVDEVDLFFHRNTYENVYIPSICMRDSTITALIDYIWVERKSLGLNLSSSVYTTSHYKNCSLKFSKWKILLDEAIKEMLIDITSFEHAHDYIVRDDHIGYSENNSILFNIVDGYKTLFAYYFEHEKGTISRKSLERNIGIIIKCGRYSYAEIPLQFNYVMGVSGTVLNINEVEKVSMKEIYKIDKQTKIPSIFGQNQLRFRKKEDVTIHKITDYHLAIRQEIDAILIEKKDQCAVLVYFESEKKLKDFYASKELESIKASVVLLTEQIYSVERERIIRCATNSGRVTLVTRAFSRGIDFKCFDQTVISSGGVHIIQTFLSDHISEEIQIQRRTARFGCHGSYSLILLDKDLERFQIERNDIDNVRDGKPIPIRSMKPTRAVGLTRRYATIYDLLHERRMLFDKAQYETTTVHIEQLRKNHQMNQKLFKDAESSDTNKMIAFLIEENRVASKMSKSRISSTSFH